MSRLLGDYNIRTDVNSYLQMSSCKKPLLTWIYYPYIMNYYSCITLFVISVMWSSHELVMSKIVLVCESCWYFYIFSGDPLNNKPLPSILLEWIFMCVAGVFLLLHL